MLSIQAATPSKAANSGETDDANRKVTPNRSHEMPVRLRKAKDETKKTLKKRRKKGKPIMAVQTQIQPIVPPTQLLDAFDPILPEEAALAFTTTAIVPTTEQEKSPVSTCMPSLPHLPLELIPPVIPENTTGKPSLRSFCSSYPKRKRPKPSTTDVKKKTKAHVDPPPPEESNPSAKTDVATNNNSMVQVVNGEIVLQEHCMVFQGSGAGNTGRDDGQAMAVVEEEAETAIVGATYFSFATGRRAKRQVHAWSVDETKLFYEALRQVGLDFGTMEAYFDASTAPGIKKRERRQLKKKYQVELARNPALVERALKPAGRVGIDLSVFQLTTESVQEYQNQLEAEREAKEAENTKRQKEEEEAKKDTEAALEEDTATKLNTMADHFDDSPEEPTMLDDFLGDEETDETDGQQQIALVYKDRTESTTTTNKPKRRFRTRRPKP